MTSTSLSYKYPQAIVREIYNTFFTLLSSHNLTTFPATHFRHHGCCACSTRSWSTRAEQAQQARCLRGRGERSESKGRRAEGQERCFQMPLRQAFLREGGDVPRPHAAPSQVFLFLSNESLSQTILTSIRISRQFASLLKSIICRSWEGDSTECWDIRGYDASPGIGE